MQTHEYVAIPAPRKAVSARGLKGVPAKFANAISNMMNEMAAEGWRYERTDTLPCDERQGLTGKTVKYHALMIFSRSIEISDDQLALPAPTELLEEDAPENSPEDVPEDAPSDETDPATDPTDEFPEETK